MGQFKRVDHRRFPDGLRERFEVKVGGLLQIGERLRLGVALAGSANLGTLGHQPVSFRIRVNDRGQLHDHRLTFLAGEGNGAPQVP